MMKWLLTVLFVFLWIPESSATTDVQKLIDDAKPGDTITVPKGQYVGSFVIDKPLTLKGEGTLVANGQDAVLTIIQTSNVSVEGLTLLTNKTAIQIKEAENISIEGLHLKNVNVGMQVYNSSAIQVENVKIIGRDGHYSEKGNGLAFYKSNSIEVSDSNITNVQDGIYLDEVKDIQLHDNIVKNGRYGVHFMYSEDGVVYSNRMEGNVTGFMVMMAKNIALTENIITKQQGLNSYGVVLYDVNNLQLDRNTLSQNRTAISIQNSKEISVDANQFQMNETAIESTKSDRSNVITTNTFTGNILTARSDDDGIRLKGNYYDDYQGIDANDDAIGDTPYVALSSFGQWMVREPAYQYFVEAPAVTVLATVDQQINRTSQDLLSDEKPMIVSKQSIESERSGVVYWQLIVGLLVVLASGFCWRKGVRI